MDRKKFTTLVENILIPLEKKELPDFVVVGEDRRYKKGKRIEGLRKPPPPPVCSSGVSWFWFKAKVSSRLNLYSSCRRDLPVSTDLPSTCKDFCVYSLGRWVPTGSDGTLPLCSR